MFDKDMVYHSKLDLLFLSILQSLGREGQKGSGCTTVIGRLRYAISPTEAEYYR